MFDFDPNTPIFDPNSVTAPQMPGIQAPNFSPYLSAGGAGYAAASTLMASQESAKLLRANAGIAGLQAQSTQEAGAEQAELYRQHLNATLGRQAASVGGANVTMSGSPLRSLETTAMLGNQDINRIQTNAARKAWGFDVQQVGDQFKARQATAAGDSNAIGGLITSGARAYGNWTTGD